MVKRWSGPGAELVGHYGMQIPNGLACLGASLPPPPFLALQRSRTSLWLRAVGAVGFPGGAVVKDSPANAGDAGLIPVGEIPGGGNGSLLQDSCLENPMDRGRLEGYSPWGRRVGHD